MQASRLSGDYARNISAIADRIEDRAHALYDSTNQGAPFRRLPHAVKSRLMTAVSVMDALSVQDADGEMYDTARKAAKRDSSALRDWTTKVIKPVLDCADAVSRGDKNARLDAFSPTAAGVPAWYNAQRLTQELLVPQVAIERTGVKLFSDFDNGARTLSQDIREYTGRAGRIARETGRPGGAARANFREAAISTDLFWYGIESVGTDFTQMELAYAGTDQQRLLSAAVERGYQNTVDEIFFNGVGTGLKPFGIATHPAMQAVAGTAVTAATTAVQIANMISEGIEKFRADSNGVAEVKRVKIGGNIWRKLKSSIQSDTMTGAFEALQKLHPGVTFEASYRLKDLETGVDGILYLADSPEGLCSIESSPLLFSWSEGPVQVNMIAGKIGGAYPMMPIYSRLDRHSVSL